MSTAIAGTPEKVIELELDGENSRYEMFSLLDI
jgi:hypothetical protein